MVYSPRHALFYDFHTRPELCGIGGNFDAEVPVKRAFLEPEQRELECRRDGKYPGINVPQFTGYALIAVD